MIKNFSNLNCNCIKRIGRRLQGIDDLRVDLPGTRSGTGILTAYEFCSECDGTGMVKEKKMTGIGGDRILKHVLDEVGKVQAFDIFYPGILLPSAEMQGIQKEAKVTFWTVENWVADAKRKIFVIALATGDLVPSGWKIQTYLGTCCWHLFCKRSPGWKILYDAMEETVLKHAVEVYHVFEVVKSVPVSDEELTG